MDKNMVIGALMGATAALVGVAGTGSLSTAEARVFRSNVRFVLSDAEKKEIAGVLAAHAPDGGSCGPSVAFELVPGGLTAFVVCHQPAKLDAKVPDGATVEAE